MAPLDVLQIFKDAGALKTGHFILSSGRHSAVFLQKALVFSDPVLSAQLSAALAEKLQARHAQIDLVCSPAVGGIIPGYETARALGCRAFYTEREAGQMCLRRGFEVAPGTKLVIVEDIVTTGLSMREACAALKRHCPEAEIIGTACMIDRSGGKADTGPAPLTTLAQLDFEDYAPDQIPASLAAIKPVKPGSRNL